MGGGVGSPRTRRVGCTSLKQRQTSSRRSGHAPSQSQRSAARRGAPKAPPLDRDAGLDAMASLICATSACCKAGCEMERREGLEAAGLLLLTQQKLPCSLPARCAPASAQAPHLHCRLSGGAPLCPTQRISGCTLARPRQQQPARRLGKAGHACGMKTSIARRRSQPALYREQQPSSPLSSSSSRACGSGIPGYPSAPSASSSEGAAATPYIQRQPPSCSTNT